MSVCGIDCKQPLCVTIPHMAASWIKRRKQQRKGADSRLVSKLSCQGRKLEHTQTSRKRRTVKQEKHLLRTQGPPQTPERPLSKTTTW